MESALKGFFSGSILDWGSVKGIGGFRGSRLLWVNNHAHGVLGFGHPNLCHDLSCEGSVVGGPHGCPDDDSRMFVMSRIANKLCRAS